MTEELKALNEHGMQIEKLEREVALLAVNYKTYAESLEHSRVDQALNAEGITNVTVVQPASFEPKPATPRKKLTLILAGLLAVFGGLGLAVASEQLDQTLRFGDDIEKRLELPLLTAVPVIRPLSAAR